MIAYKTILAAGAASAIALAATPASAVVSTFANFSSPTSAANIRFVNSGNSTNRLTDALVYSTSSATGTAKGAVNVRFSFVQPALAAFVTDAIASFTLDGKITKDTPATLTPITGFGTFFVQTGFVGTMTFLSTTAITVTGPNFVPHTYAIGSNLLTATFSKASFSGKVGDTTGSSNESSTGGSTLTFTSDFLDFTPTQQRDAALALTSTAPAFAAATGLNKALKSYRANAGGQFSSDPAPLINGLAIVPEPATWSLMIVGFAMVGVQSRRRKAMTTLNS